MIFKLPALLLLIGLAFTPAFAAEGKKIKRSTLSQYEGEYLVDGGKVRKVKRSPSGKSKKSLAQSRVKKKPAKKSVAKNSVLKKSTAKSRRVVKTAKRGSVRRPASERSHRKNGGRKVSDHRTKKQSEKRHVSKRSAVSPTRKRHAELDPNRLPYVQHTKNDRDLPFISIPNSRVRRVDKTVVMDDPAVTPPSENVAPTTVDLEQRSPAAAAENPVVVEDPAVTPAQAENAVREPDAFDMHSGTAPTLAQ